MTEESKIEERQKQEKEIILELLKKTPIIQAVCEKSGVSRATYYRWCQADEQFAKETKEALDAGKGLVTDVAENQLIKAIGDGNLTAVMFWLKSYKKEIYGNKIELTANTAPKEELTKDQEALIKKALEMGSLIESDNNCDEIDKTEQNVK